MIKTKLYQIFKLFIILALTTGFLYAQTKSDSVNFNNPQPQNSTQYKRPTILRVTGQVLLGSFLGIGGLALGGINGSLAPIGWMFGSSFGVNAVGGTKGSSFWWTFAGGAIGLTPFAIGAICADDAITGGMIAFLGIITSITAEIIFYWSSKDYGETDTKTKIKITQRKIDISNFQNSIKEYNVTQPNISLPVIQFSF